MLNISSYILTLHIDWSFLCGSSDIYYVLLPSTSHFPSVIHHTSGRLFCNCDNRLYSEDYSFFCVNPIYWGIYWFTVITKWIHLQIFRSGRDKVHHKESTRKITLYIPGCIWWRQRLLTYSYFDPSCSIDNPLRFLWRKYTYCSLFIGHGSGKTEWDGQEPS